MNSYFKTSDYTTALDMAEVTPYIVEQVKQRGADIAHERGTWLAIGAYLQSRYGDGGLQMFLDISAQYPDGQTEDPARVYRSLSPDRANGRTPSAGALINAAKRAGLDIVPPQEKERRRALRRGKSSSLSSPSSPPFFETREEPDEALPTFPEEVFCGLPSILQRAVNQRVSLADGTLLLVTCTCALSSLMTRKIFFRYSKRYRPNFITFVVGTPASGKGRASLCEVLLRNINDRLLARSLQARRKYDADRLLWQKKGKKEGGQPPVEPRMELLLLPVNSTCAALDWLLGDNDGCGFMHTSDGGELAAAWKNDYGNYAVDMLKTAENEAIPRSRKTDREVVAIREARFAAVIAATWEQVRELFGTGRDGLFSRPLFLRMPTDTAWNNQWKEDGTRTDEEIFATIASDVFTLDIQLQNLDGEVEFILGKAKKHEMNVYFRRKHAEMCRVYGPDIAPSVRRMAVTAQRMMCVITVCRAMEARNGEVEPGGLYCSDDDFARVMKMADVLLTHTAHQFCYLPQTDRDTEHYRSVTRQCFYSALGDEFGRQQALAVAKEMGITENRCDKYLRYFVDNQMIIRVESGRYKKP